MAQQLKIVGGPWCGGVTDTSAVVKASVKAKTKTAAGKLRLRLAEKEDLSQNAQVVKPVGGAWEDQDADYDFLGNNSHGSRNGGGAARKAYQIYVPHAELAKPSDGIYHSFDVGNVTFVMTDTRSRKSPPGDSDGPGKTMLGNKQKKWLMDTLSRNRDRDLVFWINSVPWLADAEEGKEHWAGYSTERAELVEFLNTERLNNLCMISGDAHMLAYKRAKADGETHPWDWGGFPIFHTASLGSPGSRKGNGYSVRPKKGWGQWGVFTVTYPDNDHVAVSWRGRRLQQVLPQAKHFPGVFEDRGQFFQVRNAKSGGRVMKYVYKRRIV